jgi:hypothetical protein
MKSPTRLTDSLIRALTSVRGGVDRVRMVGHGVYELIGPDGVVKARGVFANLITDYGDEYYARRATVAGVNIATAMRLGTGGSTAASKGGAGAAIVAYVNLSTVVLDGNPAYSDLGAGAGSRIQYVTTWPAGTATASGIDEAVITNETAPTNVAGTAGNTLSRAVLSPVVNKGASDQLVITWNHDALGA